MTFVERLIEEKKELDEKIDKLYNFIYKGDMFTSLKSCEQEWLLYQNKAMVEYAFFLNQRIKYYT